jgi:hypothetical protein
MSPRTIEASKVISDVAETLFSDLSDLDEEQHRHTGLWLTPDQMLEALELARIDDFSRWVRWKSWDSHRLSGESPEIPEPDRPRFHFYFHSVASDR